MTESGPARPEGTISLADEDAVKEVLVDSALSLWDAVNGLTRLPSLMYFLPSRHFVSFSQVTVHRGGGFDAVWREFLMVAIIGAVFFTNSVAQFRKSIAVTK